MRGYSKSKQDVAETSTEKLHVSYRWFYYKYVDFDLTATLAGIMKIFWKIKSLQLIKL